MRHAPSGVSAPLPCRSRRSARSALVASLALTLLVPLSTPVAQSAGAAGATTATPATPTNARGWRELAQMHIRRAFDTSDPSYYAPAEAAIDKAVRLAPNDPDVLLTRAGLALARHRFEDARRDGEAVRRLRPASPDALVVLIDAAVELGKYDAALELTGSLLDLKPGLAALARASYLQQLNGDLGAAVITMRQAVSAASGDPAARAVAETYLGDVLLERGRLAGAREAYERALRDRRGFGPAVIGRARVRAADGEVTDAVRSLRELTERYPLPAALALLAELQRSTGPRGAADAKATDEIVRATVTLYETNGADVDVEMALIEADRARIDGSAASRSLRLARKAYGTRQTIFTADALAWALHQSGKSSEAVRYAEEATRTDVAVASVRYHAAVVLAANGRDAEAREHLSAAARNPWFSFAHQRDAGTLAARLGLKAAEIPEAWRQT